MTQAVPDLMTTIAAKFTWVQDPRDMAVDIRPLRLRAAALYVLQALLPERFCAHWEAFRDAVRRAIVVAHYDAVILGRANLDDHKAYVKQCQGEARPAPASKRAAEGYAGAAPKAKRARQRGGGKRPDPGADRDTGHTVQQPTPRPQANDRAGGRATFMRCTGCGSATPQGRPSIHPQCVRCRAAAAGNGQAAGPRAANPAPVA